MSGEAGSLTILRTSGVDMADAPGHEVRVPVGADVAVFVIHDRGDGWYSCRCPICDRPQSDRSEPPLVGWCHFHGRGHALG